jgi:hypothetical protein
MSSRDLPSGQFPRRGRGVAIAVAGVLAVALSGCAAAAGEAVEASPQSAAPSSSAVPFEMREQLVEWCVAGGETGTISFNRAAAQVGQQPSDGRWIVSVPVEFEALGHGEQHCVFVGGADQLKMEAIESTSSWPGGEFERWLLSAKLWYDD